MHALKSPGNSTQFYFIAQVLITHFRNCFEVCSGLRSTSTHLLIYWRHGAVVSGVRRMNEVNARCARLVPGWVTVFGRVYHLGM